MNELGGELVLEAVYEAQAKLNLLDEKIFPLLPLQHQHSSSNVSMLVSLFNTYMLRAAIAQ